MSELIRVRREGGRGFRLIAKSSYDANPTGFVVVKDDDVHMVDGKLQLRALPPDDGSRVQGRGKPVDLDAMTVAQLREHASVNGIDLGDATKKADIIALIESVSAI